MESFVAMSRRDLPPSILSNILTPPHLLLPLSNTCHQDLRTSSHVHVLRPVLISPIRSRLSGLWIEKIDMISPSGMDHCDLKDTSRVKGMMHWEAE